MISLICRTEEQTRRLGLCLGARLRPGDVALLRGEMGAGKSVLARAAARGMGVDGPVPSPTFTVMNVHEGARARLYHFDLYRLESAEELYEMGLDEYLPAPDGVSLVEWPERAEEAMPARALCVRIERAGEDDARRVELTPLGGFDAPYLAELSECLEGDDEHTDA